MLEALLESHVPASAYDVIDRLAGHGEARDPGKRLAPVSVVSGAGVSYRAQFCAPDRVEECVRRLATRGDECEPGATLFLICDNCGAAAEASSETLGALVTTETKKREFMPRLRVLEVRGLCARCQA